MYICQNIHTIQNIPGHHRDHHRYSKISERESVTIEIDVLAFSIVFFFCCFCWYKKKDKLVLVIVNLFCFFVVIIKLIWRKWSDQSNVEKKNQLINWITMTDSWPILETFQKQTKKKFKFDYDLAVASMMIKWWPKFY